MADVGAPRFASRCRNSAFWRLIASWILSQDVQKQTSVRPLPTRCELRFQIPSGAVEVRSPSRAKERLRLFYSPPRFIRHPRLPYAAKYNVLVRTSCPSLDHCEAPLGAMYRLLPSTKQSSALRYSTFTFVSHCCFAQQVVLLDSLSCWTTMFTRP